MKNNQTFKISLDSQLYWPKILETEKSKKQKHQHSEVTLLFHYCYQYYTAQEDLELKISLNSRWHGLHQQHIFFLEMTFHAFYEVY